MVSGHYYRRRKWRPNNPNAWYDMTDIASLALYTVWKIDFVTMYIVELDGDGDVVRRYDVNE